MCRTRPTCYLGTLVARAKQGAALRAMANAPDRLTELPPKLQLRVLKGLDDFSDCAAVSLASPRLGLLAQRRNVERFVDPMWLTTLASEVRSGRCASRVCACGRVPT